MASNPIAAMASNLEADREGFLVTFYPSIVPTAALPRFAVRLRHRHGPRLATFVFLRHQSGRTPPLGPYLSRAAMLASSVQGVA